MRTLRSRISPVAFVAAVLVALAAPSLAQGTPINGWDDVSGHLEYPVDDVEAFNVDAFTDGPPAIVNPINGIGGGELHVIDIGSSPTLIGDGLGFSDLPPGPVTLGDVYPWVDGPPAGTEIAPSHEAFVRDVLGGNLALESDASREALGGWALAGVGDGPDAATLLNGSNPDNPVTQRLEVTIADLFAGGGSPEQAERAEADLNDFLGEVLDDVERREPGYVARDILGSDTGDSLPIELLDQGAYFFHINTDLQVGPAGGSALNELYLVHNNPDYPTFLNQSFLNDGFNGGNTADIFRDSGAGPVLERQMWMNGQWNLEPPAVSMARRDNSIVGLAPLGEIQASPGIRAASFVSQDGTFGPGVVGTSTNVAIPELSPRRTERVTIVEGERFIDLEAIRPAFEEWLQAQAAAEQPSVDPSVEAPPADPDSDVLLTEAPTDETGDGSSNTGLILLIVLGAVVVAVGAGIYVRTRGGDEPIPLSSAPGEDPSQSQCDWELHYLQPTGWEVLKKAEAGHKACCVYKVSVITTIDDHTQVATFRQDVLPERTYIPDFGFASSALNFAANTSTRSGPASRQDWQHGLGDTFDAEAFAPDKADVQPVQGEERPEIATHLSRDETTAVRVNLASQCVNSASMYEAEGETDIRMLATQECTNDDPAPGCPVELNAFGRQEGAVTGDVGAWVVRHEIGTDIDELEGRSNPALWDSHDHDSRDRLTYDHSDSAKGNSVLNAFAWESHFHTETRLDAAQLVPVHVWPSTQRVSTHIEQAVEHSLKLGGSMQKGDCSSTGCCTGNPNHVCKCDPDFELDLSGGSSVLRVDGKAWDLTRDLPSDRKDPPTGFPKTDTWQASQP